MRAVRNRSMIEDHVGNKHLEFTNGTSLRAVVNEFAKKSWKVSNAYFDRNERPPQTSHEGFSFHFFFFHHGKHVWTCDFIHNPHRQKKISTIVKVMIIVTRHNGNIQKFFLTSKPMGLRRNAGYITLHNIYYDRTCRINKYFCKIHSAWA